jgi:hypothetical protein
LVISRRKKTMANTSGKVSFGTVKIFDSGRGSIYENSRKADRDFCIEVTRNDEFQKFKKLKELLTCQKSRTALYLLEKKIGRGNLSLG